MIQFLDVSKSYKKQEVLSHITLTIPKASIWCLMGASGAGKSTFLSLLLGLQQPDSGTIRRDYSRCSAVFQENRLCEAFNALDNLRLVTGKQLSQKELEKALNAVGIFEVNGKPVSQFSGGMKRRVAILRAVLAPGELLVMDEPFQGLDVDRKQEVAKYILNHKNERTIVIATHDIEDRTLFQAGMLKLDDHKIIVETEIVEK